MLFLPGDHEFRSVAPVYRAVVIEYAYSSVWGSGNKKILGTHWPASLVMGNFQIH